MDRSVARRMWRLGEPLHAIVYFSQRSFDAWAAAGIRGFWRGYFATRAAPLGEVGPEPVIATFYNFAPSMVSRAVPLVWSMASPSIALVARLNGAHDALEAALGVDARGPDLPATAESLRAAAEAATLPGRPLYAANAALPWPDDPLLQLWHALTLLREHRGDGHNAALLAAGVEGCASHVLAAAVSGAAREMFTEARGWTDDEWDAAAGELQGRDLLDAHGRATDAGRALHESIEDRTDDLALAPWRSIGDGAVERVAASLDRLSSSVIAAGVIRFPNPMGLPSDQRG